jgi:hypothetical protein
MSFTDLFVRRPVLALVVSLLILLIGLRAILGLPIRQFPKLSNTTITVTTLYPGASPGLMQGFIATPLEQAIATAEGVDYLTSSSVQGTSTIIAYIRLDFDPGKALTEVMAKIQQVKYLLPNGAQDPIITKATGQTTAVMYVGFSSDELSSAAISDYLTRVVQPLMVTVPGVASADILGGQVDRLHLTQVGRALAELKIEHIASYSPEGRGRMERVFGTLQQRLPPLLRLHGITTLAAANRYLEQTYLPEHNARFAVAAAESGSAFVPFVGALDDILCIKEERVVSRDNCVRDNNRAADPRAGPPPPLRQGDRMRA